MLKLVSWNINGLRAALGKGALEAVWNLNPDALCLQEIKARPDQLPSEQRNQPGYHAVWNPAEKPGYSGVATFVRTPPHNATLGFGVSRFDKEGRVISTPMPGFSLLNVYFPSGSSGQPRVDYKLDFYAETLKYCKRLLKRGEQVVIVGDFNTAHLPIDLKNAKQNTKTSGFLPEERAWVQKFLDAGFVDIYRHLHPDRAQYTWWTYRMNARERGIGWRIDYFLVSEGLLSRVKSASIHDHIHGSDHCPVELVLAG